MRNASLLLFLAAVQRHVDTAATLMRAARMDALELQTAVALAQETGLVAPTGKIHPSLTLTADGRKWVADELACIAPLLRYATPTEGVV
ncbi:hypothetical protein [Roseobacter litoralis]|uniref:hypothetical protein n=1 Tax=Roseobacter litoralis TaxID=42443 RepID=UPI002494FBB9|nr:hypothetical protein [Roseobacter litoralis]